MHLPPIPTSRTALLCAAGLGLLALSASAQVTPYGSGINPPGSLVVSSGIPMVGESFTVGVSNTATSSAPAALAFLSIASSPDAAFPAGTPLPGFGLAFPGAPGELLVSLVAPDPLITLGPVGWAGGATPPVSFALSVPLLPSLSGVTLYLQGSLLDLSGKPTLGLTNGLAVTLSEPDFPGLVLIQPGTFQQGSPAPIFEPPYFNQANAQPVHQVTISKPFWIGRFEVTQEEYRAVTGEQPSTFADPLRPVENVSWHDAMVYCDLLTGAQTALGKVPTGYQYRLPTEAEWEYVSRAGTTTEFAFGPELFCDQALFRFSQHSTPPALCNYPNGTAPVGSFEPNPWGVYDMSGNVSEWCMDNLHNYTSEAKTDPYFQSGGTRMARGGGWTANSNHCRAASRSEAHPLVATSVLGFRVVLAPALAP